MTSAECNIPMAVIRVMHPRKNDSMLQQKGCRLLNLFAHSMALDIANDALFILFDTLQGQQANVAPSMLGDGLAALSTLCRRHSSIARKAIEYEAHRLVLRCLSERPGDGWLTYVGLTTLSTFLQCDAASSRWTLSDIQAVRDAALAPYLELPTAKHACRHLHVQLHTRGVLVLVVGTRSHFLCSRSLHQDVRRR